MSGQMAFGGLQRDFAKKDNWAVSSHQSFPFDVGERTEIKEIWCMKYCKAPAFAGAATRRQA